MRKKTVKYTADTLFWYSLYMLPLIIVVVSMFKLLGSDVYLSQFVGEYHFSAIILDTFSYSCEPLFEWFGNLGFFDFMWDLFVDVGIGADSYLFSFVIFYSCYLICVYLIHVCIDFVLFLPRLCHKWMSAFTREDS